MLERVHHSSAVTTVLDQPALPSQPLSFSLLTILKLSHKILRQLSDLLRDVML